MNRRTVRTAFGLLSAVLLQFATTRCLAALELAVTLAPDSGKARLTLTGEPAAFSRIEVSSDLRRWRPLTVVQLHGTPSVITDDDSPVTLSRFYRARIVLPRTEITGASDFHGPPGSELEIYGQFFSASAGDNVVTIGGETARVIEAAETALRIQAPFAAASGPLVVTTPEGETRSRSAFVVTRRADVSVNVPAGLAVDDFEVAGAYGDAAKAADGRLQLEIRADRPQVIFALPKDTGRSAFLAAVTLGSEATVEVGAASTAEALVFLHPLLLTHDRDTAERVLITARADPQVSAFAARLTAVLPGPGDPLDDEGLFLAYSNAVVSVAQNLPHEALARSARHVAPQAANTGARWEMDLENMRMANVPAEDDDKIGISVEAENFTPVDFMAVAFLIDARKAFPRGREDFRRAATPPYFTFGLPPTEGEGYPKLGPFLGLKRVAAKQFFRYFDIIEALKEKFGPEDDVEAFEIPADEPAIYLLRAVGPSLGRDEQPKDKPPDALEKAFLLADRENLKQVYRRAQVLNITAALFDLLSIAIDVSDQAGLLEDPDFVSALLEAAQEATESLSTAQTPAEVVEPLYKFYEEVTKAIEDAAKDSPDLKEKLAKAFAKKFRQKGVKILRFIKKAAKILEAFRIVGVVGGVFERANGFFSTSPLESAFVQVGDPFRLDVISITPSEGGANDTLQVLVHGATFNPEDGRDVVSVLEAEGEITFSTPASVIGVASAGEGQQSLSVVLPKTLRDRADGPHRIRVRAEGREGFGVFKHKNKPVIDSISPTDGFAAADDYLGSPFAGTGVRVQGSGFGPTNRFFFSGVEATNRSGSDGDVVITVPKGAGTGVLTVQRQVAANDVREGRGPGFKVVGPPALLSLTPESGPIGTTLSLKVSNLASTGPETVTFATTFPAGYERYGDALRALVPLSVSTGLTEVALVTPAGRAARPFTVLPGRAEGARIWVGITDGCAGPTNIPLTLAGALEIAAGKRLPNDDVDVRRTKINDSIVFEPIDLDCQWEEGDFVSPDDGAYATPDTLELRDPKFRWTVGEAVADEIAVNTSVTGDFILESSYDRLSFTADETLTGSLLITGSNNVISVAALRGKRLVIAGDHNEVYQTTCELDEGVLILGNNNHFTATVQNSKGPGVVIKGSFNEVRVNVEANAGDGVLIDGGTFNIVDLAARRNGGNGVTLTGGAEGNRVTVQTGILFGPPGSGNGGHGVALLSGVRFNHIFPSGAVTGNALNGVHLVGDGIEDNEVFIQEAVRNGGDGFHIEGTLRTRLPFVGAGENTGDGFSLSGCREISAGFVQSSANQGHGVRIADVRNDGSSFEFILVQANVLPGLKLIDVTGLELAGHCNLGSVGVDLSGEGVISNKLAFEIGGCTGDGAVVTGGRANELMLDVRWCGGHGVNLSAALANRLELHSESNHLDGLILQGASEQNFVTGSFLLNQNGVTLADGARRNLIDHARANTNRQHGFVLRGAGTTNNTLQECSAGVPIAGEPAGNQGDGIHIREGASDNVIAAAFVTNNAAGGIRVTGFATKGNFIFGAIIGSSPDGLQPAGILIEDDAANTTIGGDGPGSGNEVANCGDGIIVRDGATHTTIINSAARHNVHRGILIEDSVATVVGGASLLGANAGPAGPNFGNTLTKNETGLEIRGAAARDNLVVGNLFDENEVGVRLNDSVGNQIRHNTVRQQSDSGFRLDGGSENQVVGNQIENNGAVGVEFRGGANHNHLAQNTITGQATGVLVTGAGTVGNRITMNSILCNAGPGIDLAGGGNAARIAPTITSFSSHSVIGTTDAPDGSTVEVFLDDCGDADEGRKPLGAGPVVSGRFKTELPDPLAVAQVGTLFQLHATVTDPAGNTSEFGKWVNGDAGAISSGVAFASTRDGNEEIYLAHGFDDPPLRLTSHPARDHSPALSPSASSVVFVSERGGNADLFVLELGAAQTLSQITTHPAPDYDPTWTPDGTAVVFASEQDGNPELYRLNLFSGLLTRLTTHGATDRHPAVSPDGARIAFASDRNGDFEIFVMNADGTDPHPLTAAFGDDTDPVWSPDGQRIAFVSHRDGNAEIYTMKADGSDLIRVTSDPAVDTEPSWLAGGNALIFASNRDAGFELYSAKPDGTSVERLTLSAGDNRHPSLPSP